MTRLQNVCGVNWYKPYLTWNNIYLPSSDWMYSRIICILKAIQMVNFIFQLAFCLGRRRIGCLFYLSLLFTWSICTTIIPNYIFTHIFTYLTSFSLRALFKKALKCLEVKTIFWLMVRYVTWITIVYTSGKSNIT